jgi:hypothetical protein
MIGGPRARLLEPGDGLGMAPEQMQRKAEHLLRFAPFERVGWQFVANGQ